MTLFSRSEIPRRYTAADWLPCVSETILFVLAFTVGGLGVFLAAAQELPPTEVPSAPRFDFPLDNVLVRIDGKGEAKIDLPALAFDLPADAGELELYAIQDECASATSEEIKRNILTCPYRNDPIGFSVLRPESYAWRIDRPMRIVIGACRSSMIACDDHPEDFLIGFVSRDPLLPNMPQGLAPVTPQ